MLQKTFNSYLKATYFVACHIFTFYLLFLKLLQRSDLALSTLYKYLVPNELAGEMMLN